MKTQISRDSRQADKRYSGVYQQQGRMLTDSDINEQVDISKHRLDNALDDVVGSGTPAEGGLAINADATIQPGRAYADGVPAEIQGDSPIAYNAQDDYPDAPAITQSDYFLYLDVWDRAVSSLEDEALLDVGLHGADTCSRTQTMAQVRWCPASKESLLKSLPNKGNAPLSLSLRSGSESSNDCDPCADQINLDNSVGNYLFRVEVHDVRYDSAGVADRVTLKWSSENAGEQYKIGYEPADFNDGNWVYELFNSTTEKHLGAYLSPNHNHIEHGDIAETYSGASGSFDSVRRWDGYLKLKRSGSSWSVVKVGQDIQGMDKGLRLKNTGSSDALGYVSVGDSISINLSALILVLDLKDDAGATHDFLAGDYWHAVLREREEYPSNVVISEEPPSGVEHHYLILAEVSAGAATPYEGDDCKTFGFPRLTNLHADDVCYEDGCENLYGNATTVKEALDNLCTHLDASDIPFDNNCEKLYMNAGNVQQALDNLCTIQAADIAFAGECSGIADATNVAQALELLCQQDKGGGCAHVVGAGGEFQTLKEAFDSLNDKDTVVLCLLPGDHELVENPARSFKTLKIVGSGAASSRIIVKASLDDFVVDAAEVIFRDLSIIVEDNKGQIELTALGVDVQGCGFERKNGDKDAGSIVLISSSNECVVSWEDNHMVSIWKQTTFDWDIGDVIIPDDTVVPDIPFDPGDPIGPTGPVVGPIVDPINPDFGDPGWVDPGPDVTTNPAVEPGTIDPGTIDPGTIDPGTTDPGTVNPGWTEPGGDIGIDVTTNPTVDVSGDITGGATVGNNFVNEVNKLNDLNPATDAAALDAAISGIADAIGGMSLEERTVWAEKKPTASIDALPNETVNYLNFVQPASLGAKAAETIGHFEVATTDVGTRDAVNMFYDELTKADVDKTRLEDLLRDAVRSKTTTGFGRCLGLADPSVAGNVSDNLFEGQLVLNESTSGGVDLGDNPFFRPHAELETPVDPNSKGTLRITGNTVNKMMTLISSSLIGGADTQNPWLGGAMNTWRSMFVSENVVTERKNSFSAWTISMSSNHFDVDEQNTNDQGAFVMGYFATFTGNLGPGGDANPVRITTMVANKSAAANLVQIN